MHSEKIPTELLKYELRKMQLKVSEESRSSFLTFVKKVWPDFVAGEHHKIIAQKRPTWCVFENVYGHFSMGLDEVLVQMETINYATRTFVFPSSAIGARHKRDRLSNIFLSYMICSCTK